MGSSRARLGGLAVTLLLLFANPIIPVYAGGSTLQTLINQDRANNGGLAALTWSDCLAAVAQQNAQLIAAQGFLSHTDGPELDLQFGVNATQAGENVAYLSSW